MHLSNHQATTLPPTTRPTRILVLLFTANIISGVAKGITLLAIPWFLVHEMGNENGKFLNAMMVGLITLLSLFWGLYAGTLIDRYNRKHIFIGMNGVAACILSGASLWGFQTATVPFVLMALVYAVSVFYNNIYFPNMYAFVQELFPPRYYARLNSALEVQGQTTSFIGMMLAGLLLGGSVGIAWLPESWKMQPWSLYEIFLLDGVTYLMGMLLIVFIPYYPAKNKRVDRGAIKERIYQGFQYLVAHRSLLLFGVASYLMFFSLLILVQVMMPIYVNDYLQADAVVLASFKGIYSLGAISAGLLGLSLWIKGGHAIKQIIFLLFLAGSVYFVFATTHSVTIALASAFFIGICNAGIRILRITYIVKIVPNYVIGRVNSFFNVLNVSMRFSFILLLALPFFSNVNNGQHIVYAFGLLGLILFTGAFALIARFQTFDHEAALERGK